MSAGKVLTHDPGTSNAVKGGQVAGLALKNVPGVPPLVVMELCSGPALNAM